MGAGRIVAGAFLAASLFGCAEVLDLESRYYLGAGGGVTTGAGSAGGGSGDGYAAVVMSDEPLSYWRLAEPAGALIANNEVLGGPVGEYSSSVVLQAPGMLTGNGAARFVDGQSRVTFGYVYSFPDKASFSIELWVWPNAITSTSRRMASKEECCDDPNRNGIALSISSKSVLLQRIRNSSFQGAGNSAVLTLQQYAHIVGTYDGPSEQICLYVDGALNDCGGSSASLFATALPFTLGNLSGKAATFNGILDEVAIYDYALTAQQVATHYAASGLGDN